MQRGMGCQSLRTMCDLESTSPEVKKMASQHKSDLTEHPEEDAGCMSKEIKVSTYSPIIAELTSNLQSLLWYSK